VNLLADYVSFLYVQDFSASLKRIIDRCFLCNLKREYGRKCAKKKLKKDYPVNML
jgi:hypothetical protein